MKTLVSPTDFSPASINAINYAADMALATGADLCLLHVYQLPIAVGEVPLPLQSADVLKEEAEKRLQQLKTDLEHITSGKLRITTEARFGIVVDELDEVCNSVNPWAVVMGTTGHSAIEKVLFGNTALTVVRHSTRPVLCVPQGTEYGKGIQKVGLTTDLHDVEETIPFEYIAGFVKAFNAELHILNVEKKLHKESVAETLEQTAILGTAIRELNPQFHFIENEDIKDGIEEFAEENNLDLIIVIPRKHNFFERIFRKSATKQLVRESHIPVMCVHE